VLIIWRCELIYVIIQRFNFIAEVELVNNPENILGMFHPFIAYVVANESNRYSHALLRETSTLALCRYMSVSSQLCEQYLPLLFTILDRENDENIRTSIIIAIGDLSFRFPNSLEPWTAHLYKRLNDSNIHVRYNTLLVLTHLILNDMIKVKGQVQKNHLLNIYYILYNYIS
jgi:condensin complex subunit 1